MTEIQLILRPGIRERLGILLESLESGVLARAGERSPGEDVSDDELMLAWRGGLVDSLKSDLEQLKVCLAPSKSHAVKLSEACAFGVLRAASALRLELRERHLKSIPNEALEEGSVVLEALPPNQGLAYLGYVLLAHIQESLIVALEGDENAGDYS